jgi:hypothetical protein
MRRPIIATISATKIDTTNVPNTLFRTAGTLVLDSEMTTETSSDGTNVAPP